MADMMEQHFQRAIRNVVAYGDTDIFPYPIENTIFNHLKDETLKVLLEVHHDFDNTFSRYPPFNETLLAPVGYTGFRWATQLDPFWNLYFLGIVTALGQKIESARLPEENDQIFSYRFESASQKDNLFKEEVNWIRFMKKSIETSQRYKYVLICDIADFYPRISHHSLDNALKQCAKDSDLIPKIMKFLSNFSNTKSYSLPVGGPAARLLSELVLNKTDRLLNSKKIVFHRFADDYHIFADDRNSLYNTIVFLSEKLIFNEGLSIQKSKTRIVSSSEFQATNPIADEDNLEGFRVDNEARQLMRLSLRFDPYSPTASEDYEELKRKIDQYDIIGILQAELNKTRIHAAIVRKLVQVLQFIEDRQKNDAVYTMFDNAELLFPVFSTVLMSIKKIYESLEPETKGYIQNRLREMVLSNSHVFSLDLNKAFAIRVFMQENSPENEEVICKLFETSNSSIVRRESILAMAKWEQYYWLSDLRNKFPTFSAGERRAFIIASYKLVDEGKHWRDHSKSGFSPFEKICQEWASKKVNLRWEVPI